MLGYSQHPKEHTEAHSSLPRRIFFHDRPQVGLGKALFLPLAGEDPMEASVLLKVLLLTWLDGHDCHLHRGHACIQGKAIRGSGARAVSRLGRKALFKLTREPWK